MSRSSWNYETGVHFVRSKNLPHSFEDEQPDEASLYLNAVHCVYAFATWFGRGMVKANKILTFQNCCKPSTKKHGRKFEDQESRSSDTVVQKCRENLHDDIGYQKFNGGNSAKLKSNKKNRNKESSEISSIKNEGKEENIDLVQEENILKTDENENIQNDDTRPEIPDDVSPGSEIPEELTKTSKLCPNETSPDSVDVAGSSIPLRSSKTFDESRGKEDVAPAQKDIVKTDEIRDEITHPEIPDDLCSRNEIPDALTKASKLSLNKAESSSDVGDIDRNNTKESSIPPRSIKTFDESRDKEDVVPAQKDILKTDEIRDEITHPEIPDDISSRNEIPDSLTKASKPCLNEAESSSDLGDVARNNTKESCVPPRSVKTFDEIRGREDVVLAQKDILETDKNGKIQDEITHPEIPDDISSRNEIPDASTKASKLCLNGAESSPDFGDVSRNDKRESPIAPTVDYDKSSIKTFDENECREEVVTPLQKDIRRDEDENENNQKKVFLTDIPDVISSRNQVRDKMRETSEDSLIETECSSGSGDDVENPMKDPPIVSANSTIQETPAQNLPTLTVVPPLTTGILLPPVVAPLGQKIDVTSPPFNRGIDFEMIKYKEQLDFQKKLMLDGLKSIVSAKDWFEKGLNFLKETQNQFNSEIGKELNGCAETKPFEQFVKKGGDGFGNIFQICNLSETEMLMKSLKETMLKIGELAKETPNTWITKVYQLKREVDSKLTQTNDSVEKNKKKSVKSKNPIVKQKKTESSRPVCENLQKIETDNTAIKPKEIDSNSPVSNTEKIKTDIATKKSVEKANSPIAAVVEKSRNSIKGKASLAMPSVTEEVMESDLTSKHDVKEEKKETDKDKKEWKDADYEAYYEDDFESDCSDSTKSPVDGKLKKKLGSSAEDNKKSGVISCTDYVVKPRKIGLSLPVNKSQKIKTKIVTKKPVRKTAVVVEKSRNLTKIVNKKPVKRVNSTNATVADKIRSLVKSKTSARTTQIEGIVKEKKMTDQEAEEFYADDFESDSSDSSESSDSSVVSSISSIDESPRSILAKKSKVKESPAPSSGEGETGKGVSFGKPLEDLCYYNTYDMPSKTGKESYYMNRVLSYDF